MINTKDKDIGMTLPEVVLTSAFLSIFIGIFLITTKFTTRFLGSNERINNGSNGWLIDSHNINIAMDRWTEIFSQPAYSSTDLNSLRCMYPDSSNQNNGNLFGFPGLSDSNLPSQYKYCITESSIRESNLEDLLLKNKNAKTGIYIIYAVPNEVNSTSMPISRIFCRPKTFCLK